MAIIVLDEVTMKACRCLTREDVLKFFNSLEAGEPHPVSDNGSEHDGIFHPALDLPKVKAALWRVLDARGRNGKRLFRLQKQWYVVYKVMAKTAPLKVQFIYGRKNILRMKALFVKISYGKTLHAVQCLKTEAP